MKVPVPKSVTFLTLIFALNTESLKINIQPNSDLAKTYPGVDTILQPDGITNWGDWGQFEKCPQGSFVTGFELKTHSPVGPDGDNTGVNGIRLFCTKRVNRDGDLEDTATLESGSQRWGSWWGGGNCSKGEAVGVKLRQLPGQQCGDDVSTTDLKVYCTGQVKKISGNGIPDWGVWLSKSTCPRGQSNCGLATQVEPFQGDERPNGCFMTGDDTALNNIIIGCCQNGVNL